MQARAKRERDSAKHQTKRAAINIMKPYISNLLGTHSKRASCNAKRRYSRHSAEHAALAMAEKHREPFQAYRCLHCDFWHVGGFAQKIHFARAVFCRRGL